MEELLTALIFGAVWAAGEAGHQLYQRSEDSRKKQEAEEEARRYARRDEEEVWS